MACVGFLFLPVDCDKIFQHSNSINFWQSQINILSIHSSKSEHHPQLTVVICKHSRSSLSPEHEDHSGDGASKTSSPSIFSYEKSNATRWNFFGMMANFDTSVLSMMVPNFPWRIFRKPIPKLWMSTKERNKNSRDMQNVLHCTCSN